MHQADSFDDVPADGASILSSHCFGHPGHAGEDAANKDREMRRQFYLYDDVEDDFLLRSSIVCPICSRYFGDSMNMSEASPTSSSMKL